eukprot:jgi/Botrbrau1/6192/Bobra.0344s0032.1
MGGNSAVRVDTFTEAEDGFKGISIVDEDIPKPGAGEVLTKIILAPVNPTDVHTVGGKRPIGPHKVPFIAGNEGVAFVESNGEGASKFKPGQRVVGVGWPILEGRGTYQQYVVIKEGNLVAVPDDISDEDACQYLINPFTCVGLVDSLQVPKGEYMLQTAAASVLGKMIVRYAKKAGIKTINVVRRDEHKEVLQSIGADVVINSEKEDVVARVKEITGGKGVYGSLEAVGGDMTRLVGLATRTSGHINVYGMLSGFTAQFDVADAVYNSKHFDGWLLFSWLGTLGGQGVAQMQDKVWELIRDGTIKPEPGQTVPMSQVKEALKATVEPARKAKLFLKP